MIHKIVVVLDVEADSYDNAYETASDWINLFDCEATIDNIPLYIQEDIKRIITKNDFEHDEAGQRVLHLPPEDGKLIDRTNLPDDRCICDTTDSFCPIHNNES